MPEKGMQDASTKSQSFVGSGSFAISVDSGEDLGVDANPDHPGIDSSDDDSTDDDKLPRPRSLSYKGRSMRGKRAKRASRTTSDRRTDENVQTANSGRANYKYDQKAVLIIATALLNNARANQVYAKLNDDVVSSRGVPSQNGVAQFCTRMTKLSVQVATKFEQLSDKQWLMSESGDDDDVLSEELACAFTPLLKSVCAKDAAWQGELSIKLVRALVKLGKAKLEKQAETAAAALRASQEQEQMVAVEQSALKAAARRSPASLSPRMLPPNWAPPAASRRMHESFSESETFSQSNASATSLRRSKNALEDAVEQVEIVDVDYKTKIKALASSQVQLQEQIQHLATAVSNLVNRQSGSL